MSHAFLRELNRRKVHSAAAGYCVAVFVVWQAVEILAPIFDVPAAVQRGIVIGSSIGFPVVLVLSWFFDLIPSWSRGGEPAAREDGPISRGLRELHRRSIWQLTTGYLVGAWLILQVTETLGSLVGLPLWTGRAVLTLMLAGLPLLLATAAVQGAREVETSSVGEQSWYRRVFQWRRFALGGIAAFLFLTACTTGYLGMRASGIGPMATLASAGGIQEADPVILADLRNAIEDAELTETITELVRIDLIQSGNIHLLDPRSVRLAAQRAALDLSDGLSEDEALTLATREGVKAVISGQVAHVGRSFVIALSLIQTTDGSTFAAVRERAANEEDLLPAVELAARRIRERIGESLRSIQSAEPLSRVTTRSTEALRKYTQAERIVHSDVDRAVALLEEAVAEDSTFAMAHRKLAAIIVQTRRPGPTQEYMDSAATRAYRHRNRLSDLERYLTEAAYHSWTREGRDPEAAADAYENALTIQPNNIVALNNVGDIYQMLGRSEDRREVLTRAATLVGVPPQTLSQAVTAFSEVGDRDAVMRHIQRMQSEFPEHRLTLQRQAEVAVWTGEFAAAERWLDSLLVVSGGDPRAAWNAGRLRALLDLERGRLSDGIERFVAAYRLVYEDLGGWPPEVSAAQLESSMRWVHELPIGGLADALERFALSWGSDGEPAASHPGLNFAAMLLTFGQPARAERVMESWRSATGNEDTETPYVDALRDILEGRYTEAIDELKRRCEECHLWEIAWAFELAGEPDSAIAYYERQIGGRSTANLGGTVAGSRSYLRQARLLEGRGEIERARELYAYVGRLLENADPVLHARRDEAKAKAEELAG